MKTVKVWGQQMKTVKVGAADEDSEKVITIISAS